MAVIEGDLTLNLGLGLEYVKATETCSPKVLPFLKGTTGLALSFGIDTETSEALATVVPILVGWETPRPRHLLLR